MKHAILLCTALLSQCAAAPVPSAASAAPVSQTTAQVTPTQIVAAAPLADWAAIAPEDLLVMDLAPDAKGAARRVVIQLMPAPFSGGWVGNIRKLAAAHWWDGTSINRVQDNYVVQWGDPDGEDKAKAKALPAGLRVMPEGEYEQPLPPSVELEVVKSLERQEAQGGFTSPPVFHERLGSLEFFLNGFPLGLGENRRAQAIWPIHCYGTVGVGRDNSPDTGSGAELYTVIGQAPRQLDRNIAVVGRVIEGIEHLSSLPRGTGDIGFYKTAAERTPITAIRIGTEVPGLPRYQYLSTESASFARYADARANRHDAFYIRPAGGVDICNVPVPVRRVP